MAPKETSSSDFRFSSCVLDDIFFICGLEAATKTTRAQALNMLKMSTAIQVLEAQIQYDDVPRDMEGTAIFISWVLRKRIEVLKSPSG